MLDPFIITAVGGTFLLAGLVKGVIGLGLPTVSLAMMTVILDLPQAMALLLVPSFVTNLWQAAIGGYFFTLLRRLWLFLLLATLTVGLGAMAIPRVDLGLLTAVLGGTLVFYAGANLAGFRLHISTAKEKWLGAMFGSVNGVLAGMTGSFVVPGVLYLQAIGLPRVALVQSMGLLFTVSTVALAIALQGNSLLTAELGMLSAAAVVPALIGMKGGQLILGKLSEQTFRRVFFVSLLLLGSYILIRYWAPFTD